MNKSRVFAAVAVLLGTTAVGVGSAGLASASGPARQASASSAPPGNNGTIKIDLTELAPTGTVDHANHPHVSCQLALSFFGFDTGTQTADVAFTAQPPSGKFTPVAPLVGPSTFTFDGHGAGNSLDASKTYQLDVSGLKASATQGYHIKVSVDVTGSIGADEKYKVFWYEPCSSGSGGQIETTTTTPSTTTTSTTTPSTTTTSTTTPSTTTSTTLAPQQGGSQGLTGGPGNTPQLGTGGSPGVTGGTGSTPQLGTGASPGLTGGTGHSPEVGAGGAPSVAAGTSPESAGVSNMQASAPAVGSGMVPQGAGTDLGFFRPGSWAGGSTTPWLLMIIGGVLLIGTGVVYRYRRA